MAGDWMKIELSLPDKPEVHRIAGILGIDPDAVVGKLLRVWAWFDQHTENGKAHGVTYSLIDRITCVSGFAEAMCLSGWLEQKDMILSLPKFDRHSSQSAKTRATTSNRVKKHRVGVKLECNDETVTQPLPEKRREEKVNHHGDASHADEHFDRFWTAYPKKVGKGAALKAWKKVKRPAETLPSILKAIENQRRSEQWCRDGGQFIPHPSTYLNEMRWEDEPVGTSQVRTSSLFAGVI